MQVSIHPLYLPEGMKFYNPPLSLVIRAETAITCTTPQLPVLKGRFESPGYALHGLHERADGLTAQLALAGPACNAFGHDVANLTLEVTYDTTTRQVLVACADICKVADRNIRKATCSHR